MAIKTTDRFDTARDYVNAHAFAHLLDDECREALASIVYRRNKVWTVYASAPKDPAKRAAWHAYLDVRHARQWGALPSAGSESKVWFFLSAGRDQVDRYSRLFDKFLAAARANKGAK